MRTVDRGQRFLLAGALTAALYFDASNAYESEIRGIQDAFIRDKGPSF